MMMDEFMQIYVCKVVSFWIVCLFARKGEGKGVYSYVAMSEWLRRQTRNLLGKPAQVRILLATFFYIPLAQMIYPYQYTQHLLLMQA